ncbi:hypothetical protein ACIBEA_15000 [Streptomyces sp. NPDC051555]|uniref:hypothetical protein n=1 Tax=Streptomyces sp. NPDC051555 TaxID=3365657 RepID=UPI00379D3857
MNSRPGRIPGRIPPSRVITDSGVEHARLAYHYLDTGDLDGYGSLLDGGAGDAGAGRALERFATGGTHEIHRIVADGDCVVVMGLSPERRAFVDVFTLSDEGMLRDCRRYFGHVHP